MSSGLAWFAHCFRHYAQFNGRASRAEYWWFYAVITPTGWVLHLLDVYASTLWSILSWGWMLAVLVPHLAVLSRRLHDSGHSFWWCGSFLLGTASLLIFGLAAGGRP